MKKSVLIFGGGLSGLASGIELLKSGYEPLILEKNSNAGGLCSSYKKAGVNIDLCIHWITDTKNDLVRNYYDEYKLFTDSDIIELPYFYRFYYENEVIEISRDQESFKNKLYGYSTKKDKKYLDRFFYSVSKLGHLPLTTLKPMEIMKNSELFKTGMMYFKLAKPYRMMSKYSVEEFANKFESQILKEFFKSFMPNYYSFVYLCGLLAKYFYGKADILNMSSSNFSNNLLNIYLELGGKIIYNSPITKININDGLITSVNVFDKEYKADYYINTLSLPYFYKNLIDDKYIDKKTYNKLIDYKNNPTLSAFIIAYKVSKEYKDDLSHYFIINNKNKIKCANNINPSIGFRGYPYLRNDDGSQTLIAIIDQNELDYDYWINLSNFELEKNKNDIAKEVLELLIDKFKDLKDYISIVDIICPLDIEKRYNAYKGSYLSNICTTHSTRGMLKFRSKNIKNLYLSGQWVSTIGGIPCALQNGKFASMVLNYDENKKKINKK